MNPFKVVKVEDEDNGLGFEEIMVLDMVLSRKLIHKGLPLRIEDGQRIDTPGEVYEYTYKCIADGMFTNITDDEWQASCYCYQFESFI